MSGDSFIQVPVFLAVSRSLPCPFGSLRVVSLLSPFSHYARSLRSPVGTRTVGDVNRREVNGSEREWTDVVRKASKWRKQWVGMRDTAFFRHITYSLPFMFRSSSFLTPIPPGGPVSPGQRPSLRVKRDPPAWMTVGNERRWVGMGGEKPRVTRHSGGFLRLTSLSTRGFSPPVPLLVRFLSHFTTDVGSVERKKRSGKQMKSEPTSVVRQ